MTIRLHQLLPVVFMLVAPIAVADEAEGVDDHKPRRCINTGSILQTRVIDDGHVVFMMRRNEMYLNTLRSRCGGLSRNGRFSYRLQTRSLCELETITVIESGTFGNPFGRSCTLGMFKPVTMEDLTTQFAPVIRQRQLEKMGAPPIEEITGDDEEEQTPDDG